MNTAMKISVIIPAHNEEKYLAAALESVLAQKYPDFEVIVVDNASSDGTAEVARRYPVKLVREERKGTLWACERGRKEALGDLVVRMDADCLPATNWLAQGADLFADDSVVAVTGPYDYYDSGFAFRWIALYVQKYIYRLVHVLLHVWLDRAAVLIAGNSFMRARTLELMGGFNTDITFYGDDTDTAMRLSVFGRIVFSPSLVLKTSARRFQKQGILQLEWQYIKHFIRHAFRKDAKGKGATNS